jgi:hypothetical protein
MVHTFSKQQSNLHRRYSVHMEDVDDEEDKSSTHNAGPLNKSRVIELSDGSDDNEDDCPPLIDREDDEDDDDDGDNDVEGPEESAEAELGLCNGMSDPYRANKYTERLSKEWNSPIYVFFNQSPSIVYINDRRVHEFECAATHCKGKGNGRIVRRYLDTGDAKSTSNLRKHAKICWGDDAVAAADSTRNVQAAREVLAKMKPGNSSITQAFERAAKGTVTYSHRQHTTTEAR